VRLAERIGLTIAAPATATGGAIAIIRISGPATSAVLKKLTGHDHFVPRRATLCSLDLGPRAAAEQAIVLYFAAPASYTGEEMAELHLHGGAGTVEETLSRLTELDATPAAPGEFSFRAVVNGKMTLAQAAAIPDLVATQDRLQADIARRAAYGGLFEQVAVPLLTQWDELDTIANATVDFPEQVTEHLPLAKISTLIEETERLLVPALENTQRFDRAATPRILIAGRPNVGKSLLFNRLLCLDRAIVSPEPGTTRDYLTALWQLPLPAVTVELCDTAGLRDTASGIEKEGITRTLTLSEVSEHIVLLFDGSDAPTAADIAARALFAPKKPLVIANKADLARHPEAESMAPDLFISALTGEGVPEMITLLAGRIMALLPDAALPILLHAERRRVAERLYAALEELRSLLFAGDLALLVIAISRCRTLLGELTGRSDDPDLYERIFSSFCLGK